MAGKSSTRAKPKARGASRRGWILAPGPEEIFDLEVELVGSNPRIWRRFELSSRYTLDDLHHVLQMVMGWENSHMHQFETKDGTRYGPPMPGEFGGDEPVLNSQAVALTAIREQLKRGIAYEYDFGDGWQHRIKLKKARAMEPKHRPVCLAGENACPPEDSGGLYGYYEMLQAIKNPKHEMHADYSEWLGDEFDPARYDMARVNKVLARCSG